MTGTPSRLYEPSGRSDNRTKLESTAAEWNAENERQGRALRWAVVPDTQTEWAWMLDPWVPEADRHE